jgi:hypothetical protein
MAVKHQEPQQHLQHSATQLLIFPIMQAAITNHQVNDGVSENNATNAIAMLNANLWSSTAAITSNYFNP